MKWNKIVNNYGKYSNLPPENENVLIYLSDGEIGVGYCYIHYGDYLIWKFKTGSYGFEEVNWTDYPDYWMELPEKPGE